MSENIQSANKELKTIIGLEIHAYLDTESKLFCSCPTVASEPNSACCPICLGHPGSKPVLNENAVGLATKVGLALNCSIAKEFFFSRKTYFYPDMSKNFQITQYEVPIAGKGFVELPSGKKIRIRRAHLEEDPAALVHEKGMSKSNSVLIDYNRSGLALIEIVTEPDLDSPKEAREFLNTIENILFYLSVLKPDNTLKVDCNVSIEGNNRVEIKNVSGFAAAEKALSFELIRQKQELRLGRTIEQHTRAFDADTGSTIALRKKETEEDYGYIFDPDLVSVSLSDDFVDKVRKGMPELPSAKANRFVSEYNLSEYDAKVICSNFELSNLYQTVIDLKAEPVISARLLTRELLAILNHDSLELREVKILPKEIVELVELIVSGKVSDKNVKLAMINYIGAEGKHDSPKEFLEKNNLLISEAIDLEKVITLILGQNQAAVQDYKKGNLKSFNFLSGLVMRETKGAVDPKKVQELLKQKLEG